MNENVSLQSTHHFITRSMYVHIEMKRKTRYTFRIKDEEQKWKLVK